MSAGKCDLCGEPLTDIASILDHLRIVHPGEYGDGPERWPDGGLVVHDETDYTADQIVWWPPPGDINANPNPDWGIE